MRQRHSTFDPSLRLKGFSTMRSTQQGRKQKGARGSRKLVSLVLIAYLGTGLAVKRSRGAVGQALVESTKESPYSDVAPKSIVDLQAYRQTASLAITSGEGKNGIATLINLNPTINTWYVLNVAWNDGSELSYHLENAEPHSQRLALDPKYPLGVEILEENTRYPCSFFDVKSKDSLDQARNSQQIFAPLCNARLYLRNPAKGHRTNLEAAAEFLRNQGWGGEKMISLFHHLMEDSHRETGEMRTEQQGPTVAKEETPESLPLPAKIDGKYMDRVLTPTDLGMAVENEQGLGLRPGKWYPATGNPGIYVSIIEPGLIEPTILESHKAMVNSLDHVEASALCYLVAFDLDHFDLGYARGTEHPGVEWSEHIQPGIENPKLPGPDGIGTVSPLVSTGLISPENTQRTVATFAGGFKRRHGAFKFGELALRNYGSHYGFMEEGVVFSKLQPGLATLFAFNDGSIRMQTWEEKDDRNLAEVRYARQNGVPLVVFDERSQSTVPGPLVNNWGAGNWSGSEDRKLRTIRSGAAVQWNNRKRFLIYALFSDSTPSAMARVFQAYQCHYGMLLDLNALEHTYFALYRHMGTQLIVDHLLVGMSQLDKSSADGPIPRFLGYADNRDFFYVMQRSH